MVRWSVDYGVLVGRFYYINKVFGVYWTKNHFFLKKTAEKFGVFRKVAVPLHPQTGNGPAAAMRDSGLDAKVC